MSRRTFLGYNIPDIHITHTIKNILFTNLVQSILYLNTINLPIYLIKKGNITQKHELKTWDTKISPPRPARADFGSRQKFYHSLFKSQGPCTHDIILSMPCIGWNIPRLGLHVTACAYKHMGEHPCMWVLICSRGHHDIICSPLPWEYLQQFRIILRHGQRCLAVLHAQMWGYFCVRRCDNIGNSFTIGMLLLTL